MNTKLVGIGIALVITGLIFVGATVYQELVEEPKPEEYHMGIPMAKYRWQTRNSAITVLGFGLIAFGLGFVLVGWYSKLLRKLGELKCSCLCGRNISVGDNVHVTTRGHLYLLECWKRLLH